MKTENGARHVLVTGASSGIGAGLSRALAARGDTVWLAARRGDRLKALAAEIAGTGGTAHPVVLDVADGDACARRMLELDAGCGGLELVIANAGIGESRPTVETDWAFTRDVFRTNLLGAIATLAPLIRPMAARGRGHLVGISSLSARIEATCGAAYGASKAGLSHYLESCRGELAAANVAVTVVEPGFIRTDMTAGNGDDMPFLMDLDPAVERIMAAIDRRDAVCRFPRRTMALIRAFRLLPRGMRDRLAVRRMLPRHLEKTR